MHCISMEGTECLVMRCTASQKEASYCSRILQENTMGHGGLFDLVEGGSVK